MRLPRTIRLDPSDTFVFPRAAEPGEWAVTGSFLFWDRDPAALEGRERAAFRAGFVGVESLGFSTLVEVAELGAAEQERAVASLGRHLLERFGAPSREAAEAAAREEVEFAASLCDHPPGTVIALHRAVERGEVRERFRTLHRREAGSGGDRLHGGARAFEFVEVDDGDGPEERVDLVNLMGEER